MTRAAEALHLSQPALSGHIKALEEQFGVVLFERSSSGMTLTPSGRRLLTEATQIIDAVQDLKHLAQELRGEITGNLKLGTVLEPALLRVGDLIVSMRERYPQIGLELHQSMSSDALAAVRAGTLDASFFFGAQPNSELASIPLRDIVYRVAIPIAWADELCSAPWEAVAIRPWIVAPAPSSHHRLVMELFRPPAPQPQQIIEADSESVINNLVDSGVGASLVRDELAMQSVDAGLGAVWPGTQVTTKLWLVYPAAREADPLLLALAECLRDVWSKPL
jgi:DNA-binding transcriptional LysR family regulator